MHATRLLLAAAVTLLVGLVLAACTNASVPGWTYAPAPSATPVPSGSAGASGSPGASPSAAPSPSGGQTLTVTARDALGFDPNTLQAAAGQPFTLVFDNQDRAQAHNVVIKRPDGSKVEMGDTAFFTGPEQRSYNVPALTAGDYPYMCEVHPTTMTGTLTVK